MRKTLTNGILAGVSFLLVFAIGEMAFRLLGKRPGYVPKYASRFAIVDTLEVRDYFYTDAEGVFKANPAFDWAGHDWSKYCKINADGFRSIAFRDYDTTSAKILFLGDSFTWGASAEPITNSFADIVAKKGYLVFNTGIPSVAPNQYAFLAEKYVPVLKPDVVALMFYMGNDIVENPPMLPNKNLTHITNAGWFSAFDEEGHYLTPRQAYDHYLSEHNLVQLGNVHSALIRKILKSLLHSVVATYVYAAFVKIRSKIDRHVRRAELAQQRLSRRRKAVRDARECLARVRNICQKYGCNFMLFLIPVNPEFHDHKHDIQRNLDVFEGYHPHIPNFLSWRDYAEFPNSHLNNSGHEKYAQFIIEVLRSEYEVMTALPPQ